MSATSEWDQVVGLAIAVRRHKLQLTQEVLAGAALLHRNTVAEVELGNKSPTMGVLLSLAIALNTTPDRLVRQAWGYFNDAEKREAAIASLPPRRPGRPSRRTTA